MPRSPQDTTHSAAARPLPLAPQSALRLRAVYIPALLSAQGSPPNSCPSSTNWPCTPPSPLCRCWLCCHTTGKPPVINRLGLNQLSECCHHIQYPHTGRYSHLAGAPPLHFDTLRCIKLHNLRLEVQSSIWRQHSGPHLQPIYTLVPTYTRVPTYNSTGIYTGLQDQSPQVACCACTAFRGTFEIRV